MNALDTSIKLQAEIKAIGKLNGANEYEVRKDGEIIGWLYRERYPGSGPHSYGYVGYYPPGYEWVFQPEDTDTVPHEIFKSFKEAKQSLQARRF